jgi:ribosomal protein S5
VKKCAELPQLRKQKQRSVATLINKLPVELHIPGYNYCGPGTKLSKRLSRGDKGVNDLDEACKEHDIAYNKSLDLINRHKADRVLLEKAKLRLHSSNSSLGEKTAALGVASAMKAKLTLGMGCSSVKKKKFKNNIDVIKAAVKAVKSVKNKSPIKHTRIIPIPKTGGFLPLIPIFAALGALGSLGDGAAAIAKAVNDTKAAKEQLKETQRHNQSMEAIALNKSKSGKRLFLKPYKKGFGLFLGPWKSPRTFL